MRSYSYTRTHRRVADTALSLALLLAGTGCATTWPAEVEQTLDAAGDNRAELQRVLEHYRQQEDPQKLQAAQFLIANMAGHGYAVIALVDADGNEVEYDALDYAGFKEAQEALDALEQEHGELEFKRRRFDKDVQTVTADYLIENIELAFEAWRGKPWARSLSFDAFCQHVLPYRGSNEPINPTRRACLERYSDLESRLGNTSDPKEAADLVQRDVHSWVRFSDLYYLHPTDQSFADMNDRRLGRCEDITNMMMYAMRANAIASASDYTPAWADRDNNHAWQVILDENGRGKAGLSNRAAKVYRKTYAVQRDSLGCRKTEDEEVPRWLAGKNFIDVTGQYLDTTDVHIRLTNDAPADARFAYLCVFNGGEWRAIHWGKIAGDEVTFTEMGRNIAYLPAYYHEKELVPAAPPFILTSEGTVKPLSADQGDHLEVEIAATAPETPDADTLIARPVIVVKPGKTYELFLWMNEWVSLGQQVAGAQPVAFEAVPTGGLYWLVEEDSRRLERIFTIEDGRQVWW